MSIASEITRLQGVKSDILQAISDKGVVVPVGSALDDCPGLIAAIEQGDDVELPPGYTQVSGVRCTDNSPSGSSGQILTTSVDYPGAVFEIDFRPTNNMNVFRGICVIAGWEMRYSGPNCVIRVYNGPATFSMNYNKYNKLKFVNNSNGTWYVNGHDGDRSTNSPSNEFSLFSYGGNDGDSYRTVKAYKYSNGTKIMYCDLVPCKNTGDEVGFYDLVNQRFITNRYWAET